MRPINGIFEERLDSQSWGKPASRQAALAHHKKRKSVHNNMVLHPDPFRYGHPNPLGSHPRFGLNHSDYINRRNPNENLQFLKSMSIGSKYTTLCNDNDEAHLPTPSPSRDPSPKKPVRVDSLESLYEFFQSNSLTRTLETVPNLTADRTSVNYSLPLRQVFNSV